MDAPTALALSASGDGAPTTVAGLAHRFTSLEMHELNERQRADHISRLYEHLRLINWYAHNAPALVGSFHCECTSVYS